MRTAAICKVTPAASNSHPQKNSSRENFSTSGKCMLNKVTTTDNHGQPRGFINTAQSAIDRHEPTRVNSINFARPGNINSKCRFSDIYPRISPITLKTIVHAQFYKLGPRAFYSSQPGKTFLLARVNPRPNRANHLEGTKNSVFSFAP